MAESLVFLTDPHAARRDAILAVLQRVPAVEVSVFNTFATTRKAMRSRTPLLMIGPWSEGGETMLAARATVAGNAAYTVVPEALVLTENVSPALISLTREAGCAQLIPCDPLDTEGLYNRVMLLLRGADALYDVLDKNNPSALDEALQNMPALKRRLAA